jgi:pyruvate dehydrogenase E2 component (dihydrolipoamide acetyltransferase)
MNKTTNKILPLTSIQKRVGKLMVQSKHQMPCSYMRARADLTELSAFRKPYCKAIGTRVTTNDFFIYAIAKGIKKYPMMAARYDKHKENFIIPPAIRIGFAVSAAQGLVVPVVPDLAEKSLPQVAEAADILLKKARANKLTPDDFYGPNIVFSSLGMYGIDHFYAVSPPGATGIMSIGKIDDCLVPVDGDMMTRKIMMIAIAADNRFVNDFYTAAFLKYVIEQIEDPQSMTIQ